MPQVHTNRLNPVLLWAGGIFFVLLSIWGLRSLLRDRLPIRAATAKYQDLVITISTNGKVQPVFSFESHAPFAGSVSGVFVQQGDVVPKGKLLLTLGNDEAETRMATANSNLRAAQAALQDMENGGTGDQQILLTQKLDQAQMQVDLDTKQLASLQSLLAAGAASANEVADASEHLQAAQDNLTALRQQKSADYSPADLAQARARVSDAQTTYDSAVSEVNSTRVIAPFNGTVYSLNVATTNYITPGQDLLDMADLGQLQVVGYFDEPDIGRLAEGEPVNIVWDAKPELSWQGHVERTASNIINYGTRNVGQVIIAVDDSPAPLLPNTNVTLTVTILNRKNVLTVPREALHTDGPDNYVYKVVGGQLSRTSVQVGAVSLTLVEIVSGLSENDVVALSANSTQPMANGAEVSIVN